MSLVGRVRSWLGLGGGRPAAAPRPGGRAPDDNATTTDEIRRNWWAADALSARAANSFHVRRQLRMRSRYECANNPYLYGITSNNADDLVGTGPTLQVTTPSAGYNRAVEAAWAEWAAEVGLVEKLRTAKLAKSVDGEGFLVLKTVDDLEHPVKLYPCDLEADQVTTPAPQTLADWWVDGLTLHPVTGRPTAYHVLRHHPGDLFFPDLNPLAVDVVPARHVIHWFDRLRPGQVRGVPVFTASLDLFTELRAFRRAVLSCAELAADFAAVLQQDRAGGAVNDQDADAEYEAFKRVPVDRRMMTMLPPGVTMSQFRSEHPTTSYEMFQEKCLGEACRPLAYPVNLALGTSQKFNFSSAKLDHVNYRGGLRVERVGCDRVVLGRLLRPWYVEAVLAGVFPAYDGLDRLPPHEWHWPGFEPLDPTVDAQADHERLANGTLTYREFWARRGYDWRDVMAQQAEEKDELSRLGLEFGQPATRTTSVSEDGDPPADGDAGGEKEPKPATAGRGGRIRGFDENKVKRDANGQFSETGSSADSSKDLGDRAKGIASKVKAYGKKAVAAAKAIKTRAYESAVRATWAVQNAGVHADDIADTAHDYSKIINAKGTGDWLSTNLGVSGNTAAVVASHVMAFGITKLKQAIAKRREAREAKESRSGVGRRGWLAAADAKPLPPAEKAKAVADLLADLLPALGCPKDDLPTAAEVLEWIEEGEGKPAGKKRKGAGRG